VGEHVVTVQVIIFGSTPFNIT